jgi:hypothetical protein
MKADQTPVSQSRDLRRSRRREIDRLVTGQLESSGAPIKIRDISSGGFAMETSSPVSVGEVLGFRFASKDGRSFRLRATVAHSRRMLRPDGLACYVSGVEFAAKQSLAAQQAIKGLLETVARVLAFPKSTSV